MSDPVTNVEIEDVLSSIRRLVSNGDKAREASVVPEQSTADDTADRSSSTSSWFADDRAEDAAAQPQSDKVAVTPEKLVLTPAFLVTEADDPAPQRQEAAAEQAESHADENWMADAADETPKADDGSDEDEVSDSNEATYPAQTSDESDGSDETGDAWTDHGQTDVEPAAEDDRIDADSPQHPDQDPSEEEPLELTNMVVDVEAEPQGADQRADVQPEGADRSELVATIAELEAAVSRNTHDFEPDGSEVTGQTIAWPGVISRQFAEVQEAETVEEDSAKTDTATTGIDQGTEHQGITSSQPEESQQGAFTHRDPTGGAAENSDDEDLDDDLDDLIDRKLELDEEALRALVAQVVREELTGPLGERITRNVRKLVRREIYRILSSQEFD